MLAMILIAFLALMSLDVFGTGAGFWETLAGFLIHNIPVFILIAVLAISWKHELVGGVVFILAGLLYIFFAKKNAGDWRMALVWSLQISGAAFVIGGFFLAGWVKKRN